MKALDNKKQNILMGIDMTSSFYIIDKEILVKNMEINGMDETVTKWITSYPS